MSTGTTPRKRTSDRPTAQKNSGKTAAPATPAAQAPDTSGDEPTLVESLATTLKEDKARIVENGVEVKDPTGFIAKFVGETLSIAKGVKKASQAFEKQNALLSDRMGYLREIIVTNTGRPDWGGVTATYKEAVAPIIDEAFDPMIETRATVMNRLQRKTTRGLGVRIATYVNRVEGLGLDSDEIERVVSLKEKALEGDEKANETTQKLVAAVNKQYMVGLKSRPANFPQSPFETKEQRQRATASSGEQDAVARAESLKQFRVNQEGVTQDLVAKELLKIAQTFRTTVTAQKFAAFGEGRKITAQYARQAADILYATAKELSDQSIDAAEEKALTEAMAVA